MTTRILTCALLLLAPLSRANDLPALLKNVDTIAAPGLPGTVCAFSETAFVVVDAPTQRTLRQPVIAASKTAKSKAVVFGHDGYLNPAALKEADTTPLLLNLIAWASPTPKIATLNLPQLADYLATKDLTARNTRSTDSLAGANIVILTSASLRTDADLANLRRFADAGGTLFVAHTGWGWLQTHPGQTLADDMPANQLLAPYGLAFGDGTIEKDKRAGTLKVSPSPAPTLHAKTALDLLTASKPNPELLKDPKTDLAQASDTLAHVARAVPSDTPLLRRLNQLKSRTDLPIPSPAKPLKSTDALARVALSLQLQDLTKLPPEQVKAHPAAAAFPGAVATDTIVRGKVTVDPRIPRWHSTGLYAIPGKVVTVTLPQDATNLNLRLRIGAHTDRTYHLASWRRAPEISRSFKLDQPVTQAANAFGGLIYVEVPESAAAAAKPFEVMISNAVHAPLFVLGKTSPFSWREQIRKYPAPWAELATDKLIITLKSDAIRNLDDPTAVLEHWNKVMDASATLAGWPLERKSPERMVADADISAGYMHSGYPIMTGLDVTDAFVDLAKLRSADSGWGFYHEVGHNHQSRDWTFEGTTEVTVNLFTMHTLETVCGVSKEEATKRALVQPAARIKKYLANPDFKTWQSDPFLALAMYAQLRLEFGWEPFKKTIAEYRTLAPGDRPRTEDERRDQWMVRMSKQTGRNLGPFFQAWGVPTTEAARKSVADLPVWMPKDMPR